MTPENPDPVGSRAEDADGSGTAQGPGTPGSGATASATPAVDAVTAASPHPPQDRALPRVDALTDVLGLRVGHAQVSGEGALSGTTVVLAPEGGMTAAVDVRGGGPGTKETDALDPRNVVQRIDAVVLTGGSAYGLDAATGVMAWLEENRRGVRVGPDPSHVVPVVPAACIFDLGRGGRFGARPGAGTGRDAVEAAASSSLRAPVAQGSVGAGTGAVTGNLKGGVGTASCVLPGGITVAALVVLNAAGSPLDPATGALYGDAFSAFATPFTGAGTVEGADPVGQSGSGAGAGTGPKAPATAGTEGSGRLRYPPAEVHARARRRLAEAAALSTRPPLNTTLAVVATDAALTRAQAQKLAGTSHDGIARAVRPVHQLNDGDTVFALSTGELPLPEGDPLALNPLLAAGADLVTRALVRAVRAASSTHTPGGSFPSYRDLYESQDEA